MVLLLAFKGGLKYFQTLKINIVQMIYKFVCIFVIDPQAKDRYKIAVNEILQGLSMGERNVQQSPKYTMNNEQIEEGNGLVFNFEITVMFRITFHFN